VLRLDLSVVIGERRERSCWFGGGMRESAFCDIGWGNCWRGEQYPFPPSLGMGSDNGEATGDNLRPRSVLMTNFGETKKSDYPIWETGVSDFCSFRIKSSNDLNMKI
jgi:hypothetical protein